ncbi:lipocalin [Roseobacter denitrificans]|uniref:Outer membrane lipoprotein Blc n=1 Tax=Roseobacter denitrificans (strain ATCC 33942 / OCh 114) TaxID=375451 RepID=Q16AW1_ROSDO|nr:lipocalin family protein [Roseobacter denitrificans]ABG30882.1 outer membrane lipoprotein [Roseobacter denitrificans OCh 114]AVL53978.1 lipocalin [Roseobacter denitrificans]SFG14753.1 apolipoprotein D and lipocalin family protein [Roseobacter denitrificans OCh 114]
MPYRLALCALLLLTACGTQYRDTSVPIVAQADFDTAQYLGKWYEIARYPVSFQEGCTATTATYQTLDANRISVVNQCRQGDPSGPLDQIKGNARIEAPGQLSVQFNRIPFLRAPYWVLWVDQDYQTAVVGVPNGRAGWILARSPDITPGTRAKADEILSQNGYDPAALIDTVHAP